MAGPYKDALDASRARLGAARTAHGGVTPTREWAVLAIVREGGVAAYTVR